MICIGVMAATMDMTPHDLGMVEIKKPNEMVSVVMGNQQLKSPLQSCFLLQ